MWSSLILWLAMAGLRAAVLCPDGQVCDTGSTCCGLPGGGFGCCPLPQEVQASLPMVPTGSADEVSENLCPNAASCPPEYTCLQTPAGSYGCCPLPKAASCDDGRHCCPRGFRCSNDGRSCLKHSVDKSSKLVCPDRHECLDGQTCCMMLGGTYACCPMAHAVCCSDHLSCCPFGSQCDVSQGACIPESSATPLLTKTHAMQTLIKAPALQPLTKTSALEEQVDKSSNIICPDHHVCSDGETCCKLVNGTFACCPYPDAVCCSDYMFCCLSGSQCDITHWECNGESSLNPLLTKTRTLETLITASPLQPLRKTKALEEKGWV